MKYRSVKETAKKWGLSERSVRNYCALGRVNGAILEGKTWHIPEDAQRPLRKPKRSKGRRTLLHVLQEEKSAQIHGGIYHKTQIALTYNSNRIEGSKLSQEQTRFIFETNTIGLENSAVNVDDVIESANHFRCIDFIIEHANQNLSEKMIKDLHRILKSGTSDSRKDWFAVGEYKKFPNEVGGFETTPPEEVAAKMKELLNGYHDDEKQTLDDLLEFHYRFEKIHPFQDGNGRVGRLILFKECLKNGIVPFIIDDDKKLFYYRGLSTWKKQKGYLRDTCLSAQNKYKSYLDYYKISYA